MACCGKTIRKAGNIIKGNVALISGVKYEFTDKRVRICQKCAKDEEGGYWIGRSLWCSICKCFVPAKARVKDEKCPLGKW